MPPILPIKDQIMLTSGGVDEDDFYTIDEMAKKLKVTKRSIYNQIHKGRAGKSIPPYVKRGMLVRYLRGKQMKDYLRMVMQSL